jgi:hypothetical protein
MWKGGVLRLTPAVFAGDVKFRNYGNGKSARRRRVNTWQIPNMTELTVLRCNVPMPVQQRDARRHDQKNDENRNAIRLPSRPAPVGHIGKIIGRGYSLQQGNHSIHMVKPAIHLNSELSSGVEFWQS